MVNEFYFDLFITDYLLKSMRPIELLCEQYNKFKKIKKRLNVFLKSFVYIIIKLITRNNFLISFEFY